VSQSEQRTIMRILIRRTVKLRAGLETLQDRLVGPPTIEEMRDQMAVLNQRTISLQASIEDHEARIASLEGG